MIRFSLLLGAATVALATTPALAQSKFNVTVGGDAYFEAGYVDQTLDSGLRNSEFRNRYRLVVTPSAKADNGLEYGARLRITAENANRSLGNDRAYLFASGGFGTVQAGQINGLSDEYGIFAPSDWGTGGVDGSFPAYLGNTSMPNTAGNLRALNSGNSGTRVVYVTPSFGGFRLGATYQVQTDDTNNSILRSKTSGTSTTLANAFHDVYEVGGNYAGTFGGVGLGASLYHLGGQAKNSTTGLRYENLSSTHAGLAVTYAGLKVGGSYAWSGKSGYVKTASNAAAVSRENQDVWTFGAQYTFGATTIGAGYLNAKDAGSLTTRGKSKFELYTVGAKYVIAPGLAIGPEYNHFKLDSDVAANDDKGDIVLVQLNLAF